MEMTPEQMSKMVLTKYNDTVNKGGVASDRPLLDRTVRDPYRRVRCGRGDLSGCSSPSRKYKVRWATSVFKNYQGLEYTNARLRSGSCRRIVMGNTSPTAANPSHPTIRSGSRSQVCTMTGEPRTIVTTDCIRSFHRRTGIGESGIMRRGGSGSGVLLAAGS